MKTQKVLLAIAISLGIGSTASAADNCVLPVNNTSWDVTLMDNNGNIAPFHHVPWDFFANGTLRSGDLWKAKWKKAGCDKVHVTLYHRGGGTDVFDVLFVTSQRLIAVKNNRLYRYGKIRR